MSQSFAFKANGSVIQDQNFGTFKGFNNIYSLGFNVSNPDTGEYDQAHSRQSKYTDRCAK